MPLHFASRNDWRNWLSQNHQKESEVWFVFYKKQTGKKSISYDDAVEEALCFGWIDSIAKSIDDEKYMQKFTPRKNWKNWSLPNIIRMKKLIKENKMTDAGLIKFDMSLLKESAIEEMHKAKNIEFAEPEYFIAELEKNNQANEFYLTLSKSQKKNMILWMDSAKKQETKDKRLQEIITLLNNKEKLGLK